MKFDVDVEDYGDNKNNMSYSDVDVGFYSGELHIYVPDHHLRMDAKVYAIINNTIKISCWIPVRSTLNTCHAGEVTLRFPGGYHE